MSARLERKLTDKTAGVSGKERASGCRDVLDAICELLQKDLQSSINQMREKANYDLPNWAYSQADFIAEQRTYKKVIDLLTVKPKR